MYESNVFAADYLFEILSLLLWKFPIRSGIKWDGERGKFARRRRWPGCGDQRAKNSSACRDYDTLARLTRETRRFAQLAMIDARLSRRLVTGSQR